MAGYEFGSVIHLDSYITLLSFIGVIFFILFFDMMIELMEYFLEGTKLYHHMIQMIYKELMLMGLVSFTIIMITATQKTQHITNPTVTEWILSVDYSHILLFFLTFFFVIHAFYLMRKAIVSGMEYRRSAKIRLPDLIEEMHKLQDSKLDSWLFQMQYIPLSQVRDHIEFYLLQALFRDTYWLPEDFHFSEYLSNCFNRHALKTVNRSWITWVTLMVFAVLNYGRVQLHIGFGSCNGGSSHSSSAADHHEDTSGNSTTIHHDDDHNVTEPVNTHGMLLSDVFGVLSSRLLSESAAPAEELSNTCRFNYVKLFLSTAVVLCGYTFFIVFISRLYKIRMLHRIGLQSPDDYLDFLEFSQAEEDRKRRIRALEKKLGKTPTVNSNEPVRITNELLKQDIERVLDADEHGHHEEGEFRVLAEFLAHAFNTSKEFFQMLVLKIRISLHRGISSLANESADEDDDVVASGKSGDNPGSFSDGSGETRSVETTAAGQPFKKSALKKTKSILRRESVTEVVDSREKSFYHRQHEKKEFMEKLVSTQPRQRKWSVVKNNATFPDPSSGSTAAGSTTSSSVMSTATQPHHQLSNTVVSSPPPQDLTIIREESNRGGSNHPGNNVSAYSTGSDGTALVPAELPAVVSAPNEHHTPAHHHHGPPHVKPPGVQNEKSIRRRSVIEMIHHLDLPEVDQERNMIFTATHNVHHHGIGNSLRVAMQHANKESSLRSSVRRSSMVDDQQQPTPADGQHHHTDTAHQHQPHPPSHPPPHATVPAGASIRRMAAQDDEPHSAKHHHNVKNSVVVHAPEHGYSTVEKFLKKQNEEHHLMMMQLEQQGHNHGHGGGFLGTMRHVGDALSIRGGGGGGGGSGAPSMRRPHASNPVSTRMKAVSIRRIPVQRPAPGADLEAGNTEQAVGGEEEEEEEVRLNADFSDIYMFGNVVYFHRAVELCILFNCLYMAFWTTDFIAITSHIDQPVLWRWLDQLAMIIPVVLVLPCIGYIAETCSLLNAIATLNLEVVYEVLEDWEDTNRIISDLRKKIMTRIAILENAMEDKVQIIHELFDEIDQDGSGRIDKIEFRFLLRTLKLTYSDDRFNRLFRAVDASGEGSIGWEELFALLFPEDEQSNHNNAAAAASSKKTASSPKAGNNTSSAPGAKSVMPFGGGMNSSLIPPPITTNNHHHSEGGGGDRVLLGTPRSMSSSKRAPAPHVETVQEIEDVDDEEEAADLPPLNHNKTAAASHPDEQRQQSSLPRSFVSNVSSISDDAFDTDAVVDIHHNAAANKQQQHHHNM